MKKKSALALSFVVLASIAFSGCAGTPATHTYWRKNPQTETYSRHDTYSRLSADEIRELGLVKELPEDAKTIN